MNISSANPLKQQMSTLDAQVTEHFVWTFINEFNSNYKLQQQKSF